MNLPNEIRKFCAHSSRLRVIFEDTLQCFQDINCTGNFDNTQIVVAELLKEEQAEIVQTVKESPSFVVFGQTPYAKSRLINELFDKPVLPCLQQDSSEGNQWRLVCFKQKTRRSTSPFTHSNTNFSLADSYEFGDSFEAQNPPAWDTIPVQELIVPEAGKRSEKGDSAGSIAYLEVILDHPLLENGMQVVMAPSGRERLTTDVVKHCVGCGPSILLYGFSSDSLSEKDVQDLTEISKVTNFQPIAFVRVPRPGSRTIDTDPPDGAPRSLRSIQQGQPDSAFHTVLLRRSPLRNHSQGSGYDSSRSESASTFSANTSTVDQIPATNLHHQLCALGYLPGSSEEALHRQRLCQDYFMMESQFIGNFQEFVPSFSQFARQAFQRYLVNAATVMNNSHTRCLNMFILSAFEMSRDLIFTPKKIDFVKSKERELYKSLMDVAVSGVNEIKEIVAQTIRDLSDKIQEDAANFNVTQQVTGDGKLSSRDISQCAEQIQDMVLSRISDHVASKLLASFHILQDTFTGTLTRCLESLEEQAETAEDVKTTDALKQILNAAYQVEITVRSSSSFISCLLEKMKQLMMSMPWKNPPEINSEWKRKVATDMLSGLNEAKLARSIAGQIKERLHNSHVAFAAAIHQLDRKHSGRLDLIQARIFKLRKVHAPCLAKLALESTSLRDMVLFGMPSMGREIGRGQYGVVYSCDKWASYSPVAIKSVVPPDEKHWKDLALEFFYTKSIPEHPRVVMVRGSVIDYKYGGGMSPAVLLVMDRLQRDLHTAIMQNLGWPQRLQVSIDVVEGLRFLHSQGLIHRDVKLKNVLLDSANRGKISDLGFCKPEAMMSGSIVGTPIHMAPELVTGHYDSSVDVYAFGILFWYVCAGHVDMPSEFRRCVNKDDLWTNVRNGVRPEQLKTFTDTSWNLMESCWRGDPASRPYFGDVQDVLCSMRATAHMQDTSTVSSAAEQQPSKGKKNSYRISPP